MTIKTDWNMNLNRCLSYWLHMKLEIFYLNDASLHFWRQGKFGFMCNASENNRNARTKRLMPWTFRHFSTGSVYKRTSSYFLKWLRNVVLPAPIFPSISTVNGALRGEDSFGMDVCNTFDIFFLQQFFLLRFTCPFERRVYNSIKKRAKTITWQYTIEKNRFRTHNTD